MAASTLRVLHAAVSVNPSPGVVRQMESEHESACDLGMSWDVALHTTKKIDSVIVLHHKKSSKIRFISYLKLRLSFYGWLRDVAPQYDIVILRHSVHDPMEALFSRAFGKKLLTVHHTLEIAELFQYGGVKGRMIALLEKWIGGYTLKHVRGVIGVTDEILSHEQSRLSANTKMPKFIYPNGIHCSKNRVDDKRGLVPEIIFVASYFAPWHGLDLLIDSSETCAADCIIHIVGNLPYELRIRCERDKRFRLHGLLTGDAVSVLLAHAWCGLSSFALFRKSMHEACTLKVREYLDAGIPVYSGHKDIFPDEFSFFRIGKPLLNLILIYAEETRKFSRSDVFESAKIFIDKKIILRRLEAEICNANLVSLA
jgi:hypothetical protein